MVSKIKQAVILSAGLGTRLQPLTNKVPKVMLPLAGKPILEHHILGLKRHGVGDIFINLHYLPEVIRNYFSDGSCWGMKVCYAFEPTILGTAGGVKNFEKDLSDNFFVIYGDVFNQMDYSKMAEAYFNKRGAVGLTTVGDTDHPYDSDLVEVDNNLRFLKIHAKPHKSLPPKYKAMRAAAFIFNKRILERIPSGRYYEIDHELLPALISKGEAIYGYEGGGYIKDIGTPERYREASDYLVKV